MTTQTTSFVADPALVRASVPTPCPAPLRVMHVVYVLRPGGMEFGVVKLVNGTDRSLVHNSICSTRPADAGVKALVASDVPVFELDRRDGNDPRLVRALARLFRRERPDVVHTHAWGTLLEGLLAARLARVPIVIHGEHGTLQLRAHQRWLQRLGWSSADRVLAVSSRLAERMARETQFPLDKIQTIRNGVDLSRFGVASRDEARRTLGLAPDTLVIGTAGRLVPVKDHRNLLEAIARLRTRGLNVHLLLAGEGPLRSDLEQTVAALGLQTDVRFLGHCPQIERVFAALDIFALSSSSEGLSNTILEAMASGLPVVATNVGGADELVDEGRTGLLVPARSPDALAAALARLATDAPLRLAMGAAARRRSEADFDLPAVVRRYEALYLGMAAARVPGMAPQRTEVR